MGWLIFLRVILSVSASAVQKRLMLDRAGIRPAWILTYAIMLGPAVLVAVLRPESPPPSFWRDIALGGALDAAGNLAMTASLRATDLSVFGPLNALRPVIALLFGWAFLGESPSAFGLAGVSVTAAGGVLLFWEPGPATPGKWAGAARAILLRVTGLGLGVFGAVFLKRAASAGSAELTVAAWIASGLVVLASAAAIRQPRAWQTIAQTARAHPAWLLGHGAVFLVMQWLTIRIFQETLLAYSFVYFQLGIVLQVFAGRLFFQEPAFARRLSAAAIMAAGSVLVLWKG